MTRFTLGIHALSPRFPIKPFAIALMLLGMLSGYAHDSVQLAISGHHGQTDPVKPGGDWWGIFPEGDGFTLKPTRVRVETVIETPPGGKPYVGETNIHTPEKVDFVILFRGLMAAAMGPVDSVPLTEHSRPLAPGETRVLSWKGLTPDRTLHLAASGESASVKTDKGAYTVVRDYAVRLGGGEDGAGAQILYSSEEVWGLEGTHLRWAGDLDRDGKLDLILNLGGHYTQTRLALYLSSAAKDGELVGLVARWDASCGC